jgi:hypothetical protein
MAQNIGHRTKQKSEWGRSAQFSTICARWQSRWTKTPTTARRDRRAAGFGTTSFANRYHCMTTTGKHVAVAVAVLLVSIGAAIGSASAQTETQGCTKQERNNQPLGQKLGQSGGVICPPDIDPAMKAPTPDAGKTPIIPPPGSPGGNPNVQPK